MLCHPERRLARFLRQSESKDLRFGRLTYLMSFGLTTPESAPKLSPPSKAAGVTKIRSRSLSIYHYRKSSTFHHRKSVTPVVSCIYSKGKKSFLPGCGSPRECRLVLLDRRRVAMFQKQFTPSQTAGHERHRQQRKFIYLIEDERRWIALQDSRRSAPLPIRACLEN
jgi:hypothetical protein